MTALPTAAALAAAPPTEAKPLSDLEALDSWTEAFLSEAMKDTTATSDPMIRASILGAMKESFGLGFRAGLSWRDGKRMR